MSTCQKLARRYAQIRLTPSQWTVVMACALVVLFFRSLANAESNSPSASRQILWESGKDGYHTYRIPSLIVTKRGTVLAFCEGRKLRSGDQGDIDLLVKRSDDGGLTWSKQQIVWDDAGNTCGNPCPVIDQGTGVIWMLMTWNRGDDTGKQLHDGTAKGTRHVFVTSSSNDGRDWTPAEEITQSVKKPDWFWFATGPGVGIQIRHGEHAGRMVIPCDYSAKDNEWGSAAVVSDDHGKTWNLAGCIQPLVNECQVVELDDAKGSLLMNLRSADRQARTRFQSISRDGGETWSSAEPAADLPDPICQGSLIRHSWQDGGIGRLLFSNPAHENERRNLTVRMSIDDGKTWPYQQEVFAGPSAYSCLTGLPNGQIGLAFEGGAKSFREGIFFDTLSVEDLARGKANLPNE